MAHGDAYKSADFVTFLFSGTFFQGRQQGQKFKQNIVLNIVRHL